MGKTNTNTFPAPCLKVGNGSQPRQSSKEDVMRREVFGSSAIAPVPAELLPVGGFRGDEELPPGGFRGEEVLPPGGFRGDEQLPPGGFRGDEELPPGGFRGEKEELPPGGFR